MVGVVSTNWQNDYARKAEDYAILGIAEYWIVDYLGVGCREYIGKTKQPTITVCSLLQQNVGAHRRVPLPFALLQKLNFVPVVGDRFEG